MGKVELMQEKIEKQRELPDEIKDKLDNITFINLVVSIILMIYIISVNLLFINEPTEVFLASTKISAIIFIIVDIIIFELSYRKDSGKLAIHAIELFCVGLLILATPYVYFYVSTLVRSFMLAVPIFFSIYYVGKSIVIHLTETNKYRNHLSDIQEILQDDNEKDSYIDDVEIDEKTNSDD